MHTHNFAQEDGMSYCHTLVKIYVLYVTSTFAGFPVRSADVHAPAPPLPMSHPSMRPRRAAAARTNAAIDASLRVEAQTTRLGKIKKI